MRGPKKKATSRVKRLKKVAVIQIFGRKKCFDTKKAQRFFKERGIPFQFIDLDEKGMSEREFRSVVAAVGADALIDKKSKDYDKFNFPYILRSDEDKAEILFQNQSLIKSPVIRKGNLAAAGFDDRQIKELI